MSTVIKRTDIPAEDGLSREAAIPHLFNPADLSYGAIKDHALCVVCNLPFAHSIHANYFRRASELVVSDRLLTCAACRQVVGADGEGYLRAHRDERAEIFLLEVEESDEDAYALCPGSYTKGYPHRMLPEATPRRGFTYLKLDDVCVSREVASIQVSVRFLSELLSLAAQKLEAA